jgi:HAD superfamily hydrolase (TIGR01509 family)
MFGMARLSWVRAVIFDVDGTLYDQRRVEARILFDASGRLVRKHLCLTDLKVLYHFGRIREYLSRAPLPHLEDEQYSLTAWAVRTPVQRVKAIVTEWLLEKPLRYLPAYRLPGTLELFQALRTCGFRIGIFSDYPPKEKIAALGLHADQVSCATDPDVDALKPDPKGLLAIAGRLGVRVEQCLMVGDRDDKDGEAARRAGMHYLIVKRSRHKDFFFHLRNLLIG